ncbi:MAG: 50S ribosomal protein L18Ae [Sulfolobaceae archaeon]
MSSVRVYQVKGIALFGESRYPVRQKFVKYVPALNEKQVVEYIYSFLGSKNKIKRYNIKILEIKEVNIEEIYDKKIKDLLKLGKIIL